MAQQPRMSADNRTVKEQAQALAKRFQAEYEPTIAALQRLLDDKLQSLIFQQNDLPESDAVENAASVLLAAY